MSETMTRVSEKNSVSSSSCPGCVRVPWGQLKPQLQLLGLNFQTAPAPPPPATSAPTVSTHSLLIPRPPGGPCVPSIGLYSSQQVKAPPPQSPPVPTHTVSLGSSLEEYQLTGLTPFVSPRRIKAERGGGQVWAFSPPSRPYFCPSPPTPTPATVQAHGGS